MFDSKHQKRVNECYPQGTGEVGAAAGKISALTYYINAKPAKLLKVAAYLERKVPRDLTRQSAEYNAATLEIVRGIMANCSEYFVSFAPTVLRLLMLFNDSLLAGSLKKQLNSLFVECCRMTKAVLPSIRDAEFFSILTLALDKMLQADCMVDFADQELIANNVQAAVAMEDFRGPKGEERIAIINKAILCFFRAQDNTQLDIENISHRPAGKAEPIQIVGNSFANLVEGSNSATVPIMLNSLFREFDAEEWIHQRLSGGLLNVFVHSVPAQYLCVVLSEFFRKLEETEDSVTTVLADTIAELLRSNRSPLGYSGLELARNLLKLLRKQRPDATEDTRASIIVAKVRPPRTIYSICNAFVALLRNANFALQKYEIIESIISKAFFKDMKGETMQALERSSIESPQMSIPITVNDRHSMLTVTLDRSEEFHFRSVVWGILFALAEEGSSPSVLRLAFVEVHVKLFEMLFRMIRVGDEDVILNTLVFWRQLLIHGLPIAPNRRNTAASGSEHSPTIVLGRPSLTIFANTRLAMAYLANSKDVNLSLMHVTAILSLLKSLLGECDLGQLAIFIAFVYWLYQKFTTCISNLTMEDRGCIIMCSLFIVKEIGLMLMRLQHGSNRGDPNALSSLADDSIRRLREAGMSIVDMEDILDASRPVFSLFKGYEEVDLSSIMPSEASLFAAFHSSASDSKELLPYSLQLDQDYVANLQQRGHEKASFHRSTLPTPSGAPNSHYTIGNFSRLSKLGMGAAAGSSARTAPAFYQLESASSAMASGSQPTRALTVSSSSLAHSESQSINSTSLTAAADPLEERFDQLSVKMREKRQKDRTTSLLFFKKK